MVVEAEKLRADLKRYRLLRSRVAGRLALEALEILISEGEARLRAIERGERAYLDGDHKIVNPGA
jgi:hypothetical protein